MLCALARVKEIAKNHPQLPAIPVLSGTEKFLTNSSVFFIIRKNHPIQKFSGNSPRPHSADFWIAQGSKIARNAGKSVVSFSQAQKTTEKAHSIFYSLD